MRTTIELPAALRRKLVTEAAARNIKGFSTIIAEALEEYFKKTDRKRTAVVAKLKGSLTSEEIRAERQRLAEGRRNWRQ